MDEECDKSPIKEESNNSSEEPNKNHISEKNELTSLFEKSDHSVNLVHQSEVSNRSHYYLKPFLRLLFIRYCHFHYLFDIASVKNVYKSSKIILNIFGANIEKSDFLKLNTGIMNCYQRN